MNEGMHLIRLTEEHVFKPFDCGEQDLNDFLLCDSKEYLRRLVSVTYIIETEDHKGCTFITVDALRNAIPFYINNGFLFLDKSIAEDENKETCPLYFDLYQLL